MIGVSETLWRNPESSYIRVLTNAIAVKSRRCSLPLQRAVSDFGLESSFEKSTQRIAEHYGFELPLSAVATVTREHAEKIALRQQSGSAKASALPASGVEELVAEADGSFVRIVSTTAAGADARKTRTIDYREARLFASVAQGSDGICYDATFGSVDTVATLWAQTAKTVGMSTQSHVHVLADGAPWIDSQRLIAFGNQGDLLIDLYHVLEYISEASKACSDQPKRWLKTQKKRLKSGRSSQVILELKKYLEPESQADELSPVRRAWRYLKNRSNYLAYDKAIEKELPLGSGLIESGNKHVLQARMKIPGASWNIGTAENFVRTRAMRANDQWKEYWEELKSAA